ncbi:MAG: hypothetical protein JNM85_10530 [Chthonomonas sp.]|nr:hypothetical protein [Chthonomonas sp.]
MNLIPILCTLAMNASPIDMRYESTRGLFVTVGGVEIVRGGFFQYYKGNWEKGLYSSNWNPQTVTRDANGDLTVVFTGPDRLAHGMMRFVRTASGVDATYTFGWRGTEPANVENTVGCLWATAFKGGEIRFSDGSSKVLGESPRPTNDPKDNSLGPDSSSVTMKGRIAEVSASSPDAPLTLFDARNYQQDFARDRELLWLGHNRLTIPPQGSVTIKVSMTISKMAASAPASETIKLKPRTGTVLSPTRLTAVIPAPRESIMSPAMFRISLDPKPRKDASEAVKLVMQRFADATFPESAIVAKVDPKLNVPENGYTVAVGRPIKVTGKDAIGLRMGLTQLGQLIRVNDGAVTLVQATITDWPTLSWRGAHLFVGPNALDFQTKFHQRVLGPLGYNKMVLQAEQARWKSLPGIYHANSMNLEDLQKLFAMYRSQGIDPIPLIQSFGHMEWFFANGQNLDLAFNRSIPYSVDPRKPGVAPILNKLWDEVVELLKPSALHFGLDEVDMRGFPGDQKLVTELWRIQIPMLGDIAKRHNVPMMLWGDKCLAPGEAPDAALGYNKEEAMARRQVIPKGAMVTDWHYIDNPDPRIYTSLEIFKKNGQFPIASGWNRLGNIIGFAQAAAKVGGGYLQTTWSGYFSEERALVENPEQYAAFIVAGDYAWTGRTEGPKQLGYDPLTALYERYFAPASPTKSVSGMQFGDSLGGKPVQIGPWMFDLIEPVSTTNELTEQGAKRPRELVFELPAKGVSRVGLAIQTENRLNRLEDAAEIIFTCADGSTRTTRLKYLLDVRAGSDPAGTARLPRQQGYSAVTLQSDKKIVSVKVRGLNTVNGIRVGGISALP